MSSEIVQLGSINAFMAGALDGAFPVAAARAAGSFGLGCSDALAGEVTVLDGRFLEAGADRRVVPLADTATLSFAQLTDFHPDRVLDPVPLVKSTLYRRLAEQTRLDNVFLAIRVRGVFDRIRVRRPVRQEKPYRPIREIMSQQIEDEYTDLEGTMIGFWTPEYFREVSVSGFHTHFLSTDLSLGGHVLDYEIAEAELAFERKLAVAVRLPDSDQYLDLDLTAADMQETISAIEH